MNFKDSCILFFTTVHAAYLVKAECEPRSFLSQLQAVVTYISVCIRTYRMLPHTAHTLILYTYNYTETSTETVCVHNCRYFCCKGFITILSWWSCETRSPDRHDLPNEVFTLTGYSASGRVQGYLYFPCLYVHTECDIQCNTSRCTYKGSVGLRVVITSMTSAAMCIPL